MPDWLTELVAVGGLVTGVLGTVIGILSYRLAAEREKVRIRAEVAWGYRGNLERPRYLSVSVVNLSAFPITLKHVGIEYERSQSFSILSDIDSLKNRLPLRLESREALTLAWPKIVMENPDLLMAKCFYVETACQFKMRFGRREIKKMKHQIDLGHGFEESPKQLFIET